jgi:hypothetical protein
MQFIIAIRVTCQPADRPISKDWAWPVVSVIFRFTNTLNAQETAADLADRDPLYCNERALKKTTGHGAFRGNIRVLDLHNLTIRASEVCASSHLVQVQPRDGRWEALHPLLHDNDSQQRFVCTAWAASPLWLPVPSVLCQPRVRLPTAPVHQLLYCHVSLSIGDNSVCS